MRSMWFSLWAVAGGVGLRRVVVGALLVLTAGRVEVWATGDSVFAVGYNTFGQLGNGRGPWLPAPSLMADGQRIAAGSYHSLALRTDGTVWAWGYNVYGQLGDGTTSNRLTPVQVSGLTGVTAISPDLVLAHRHLRLAAEHFHVGSFAAARDIAAP